MENLLLILGNNPVFATALFVLLGIAVLEGILSLLGFGVTSIFDTFFPEADIPSIEVDNPSTTFSELFSWLNKGRVPVVMLFISFLGAFGTIGIFIQENLNYFMGYRLNVYIAIAISLIISFPIIRYFSIILGRILPKDETTAVSKSSFIGNYATIILGTATYTNFVQAKFIDIYNQEHYVMVQSGSKTDIFKEGDQCLLMKELESGVFLVMKDPNRFVVKETIEII